MKRLIVSLLTAAALAGCGDNLTVKQTLQTPQGQVEQRVTYETVGIFNDKNPEIEYEVIVGNVVWAIILFETIIAPIYFIGWSLQEPVGFKDKSLPAGAIKREVAQH
jgi:hypothetical protein